jgi:sugar phosphate isomerase/epimerase
MDNIRIGFCEWAFPISGIGGISFASRLGIQSFQLTPGPYYRGYPLKNGEVQEKFLECASKYGVVFSSISIDSLMFIPLTSAPDSVNAAKAIEAIKIGVDIAKSMNIPVVMTSNTRASTIKTKEDFNNTISILKIACDYACKFKKIIANENYLNTEDNLEMFKCVGRENFNIFFDTQNPRCFSGLDAPSMILELSEYICNLGQIHVKDGVGKKPGSVPLGDGDGDFYKCVTNLRRVGFTGDVFIENFYTEPLFAARNYENIFDLVENDILTVKKSFNII